MAPETGTDVAQELTRENAELRAQIEELQNQLAEQAALTNEAIARAQERVYWLDRWHIDMDTLVAIPGISALRALVRFVRAPLRMGRKLVRRMSA